MISNQILQNTLDGLKAISRVDFSVIDTDGKTVASTVDSEGDYVHAVVDFVKSPADSQEVSRYQFFKIYDEQSVEYVLVATGSGEDVYMVGKMATFQIQNLLIAYKERFDKDNFIKNLLLDNLLLVDIYSRSKKLHIRMEAPRSVLIAETEGGKDINAVELVRGCLPQGNRDFTTAVDENSVIIVKETESDNVKAELEQTAKTIIAVLEKEGASKVHVAYGSMVGELKEVSRSYKEAKMALDVGRIFFDERQIVAYSELGIGRLIYQLPIPLCKMFIREIFGNKSPDEFDEETIITINKFFENSLNVSETSRQLFIHRNTLVYRLDKLQKSTGLDLRVFEDAITFKIAMMVAKYMKYMESFEY
ncbi:MAG: helix-turn-helix domain-containing protein [Lachnospiraceae bacterium]|nr:helix-turn-helix domain-containing protein [Lachnospiraceae bacterium]